MRNWLFYALVSVPISLAFWVSMTYEWEREHRKFNVSFGYSTATKGKSAEKGERWRGGQHD
jgi:hypothetical protein